MQLFRFIFSALPFVSGFEMEMLVVINVMLRMAMKTYPLRRKNRNGGVGCVTSREEVSKERMICKTMRIAMDMGAANRE
tara:strand:- start:75 stop:311 length:237 start_codon:yes stop_codon:yes gene_type:complete